MPFAQQAAPAPVVEVPQPVPAPMPAGFAPSTPAPAPQPLGTGGGVAVQAPVTTVFCTTCGHEMGTSTNFCGGCGARNEPRA